MTYTRTKETEAEFTVRVRTRETERRTDDPENDDPTPSFPALRVVTVDGICVDESTRPLSKCRQVSPLAAKLKRAK